MEQAHKASDFIYDQNRSGEMVSRITNDTTIVMNLLSTEMIDFVKNILSIIVAIVILFTLDVPMTLILLAVIPVMFVLVMPLARKIHKISREQQDKMSKLTAFLAQMLSEIRLIKVSGSEKKRSWFRLTIVSVTLPLRCKES